VAARALVAPLAGVDDAPLVIGLADRPEGAIVRYAADAEAFLVLDGDRARLVSADVAEIEPVESRWGYPLGRVRVRVGGGDDVGSADRLRRAWQIGLAVEAAGTMLAAVRLTTAYVAGRHQFGRPIGSFQAVQHRLARAHVAADGTRWLGRRAAWHHDDEFLTAAAAAYACQAATTVRTDTHQVSGAMGVTREHGLVIWTTRLVTLQRELGGGPAHAARVLAARRAVESPTQRTGATLAAHGAGGR
jgi:hypothetical protein